MDNFKNVVGYDCLKLELSRIIDMLNNSEKYKKLGVKQENALLLFGKPGVGKTTIANDFLSALKDRKQITLRKTKDGNDFIEEINNTFNEAINNQPSIILFDDFDKFANNDEFHVDAPEYVAIQSGIDNLSANGYDVFIFATANDISDVPDSLTRPGRMKTINVSVPKGKDARDIISYFISKKQFDKDVDAIEIARLLEGSTCAEIEDIINQAGIYAAYENKDVISRDDLIKSCLRTIQGIPEILEYENEKVLESVAVHESGHALIGEVLEPGSINLISVKKCKGDIGGVTCFYQNDDYWSDKYYMENRVISLLGGKAATEIYYGKTDIGCNNDLHRAFDIIERFVDNYSCYGFDKFERQSSSDVLRRRKEDFIYQEIERYYQKAKQIIIQNKDLFIRMKDLLMAKKVLCANDIKSLTKNDDNVLKEKQEVLYTTA